MIMCKRHEQESGVRPALWLMTFCLILLVGCGGSSGGGGVAAPPNGGAVAADEAAGKVLGLDGPLVGARVRVQATENLALTDASGAFSLKGLDPDKPVTITAWSDGYYCTLVEKVLPPAEITFNLVPYQLNDNKDYQWLWPVGEDGCISCHPAVTEIQLKSAHANAAANIRFLTMYNGTDTLGNQSPATTFVPGSGPWPGGVKALPPDLTQPYYGPGVKLDAPVIDDPNTCSACHIPGASIPHDMDPNDVTGADTYGIHCDFCHKVAGVHLNPATGLPREHLPGVHSMDIRRPFNPEETQLFIGSLDDPNVAEDETYLPLYSESRYCAPCHFGVFWDTVVYNSYGEWLDSPYSDPETGQTCQDCHMPSPMIHNNKVVDNLAPGKGGVTRDPNTLHAHSDLGASDPEFLRTALTMTATADLHNNRVRVQVNLTNDKTGHHVPTDSPLRHLILLVEAVDESGALLAQVTGPTLPEWCGEGDPADGYYAGLPGQAYAKILKEAWTDIAPTGAYWNPIELVSDNRLAAMASDMTTYEFTPPVAGRVDIRVTLKYRRAFIQLMDWKKWDVPDIVMAEETLSLIM
jgi:hypothetical protein